MGISLLTALTIQGNDTVKASAGGPDKNGKYTGWITGPHTDRWNPMVNSEPIYDSEEEALAAMQDIIDKVRAADLSDHKKSLFEPPPTEGDSKPDETE